MTAASQQIANKSVKCAALKRSHLKSGDIAKRLFDIIFSVSVLMLCAPVYLVLAVSIACTSSGSIFYVQERVGKNH